MWLHSLTLRQRNNITTENYEVERFHISAFTLIGASMTGRITDKEGK
jgi:hypothetical protein